MGYNYTNPFYSTDAWKRLRKMHLARQPLCVECNAAARVVDHILPMNLGGAALDQRNLQSMCDECHNRKRQQESRGIHQVLPIGKFQCEGGVRLLCGPPCAGKTRWQMNACLDYDRVCVIDLDRICTALNATYQGPEKGELLTVALAAQRAAVASLSNPNKCEAFIHLNAPTFAQRDAFKRAGAQVMLFVETKEELYRRLRSDPSRIASATDWEELIEQWFEKFTPGCEDFISNQDAYRELIASKSINVQEP